LKNVEAFENKAILKLQSMRKAQNVLPWTMF